MSLFSGRSTHQLFHGRPVRYGQESFDFREADHPRASNGQFGKGGGSALSHAESSKDHKAALEAIPEGESRHVRGWFVRRTGPNKFRLDTDKGFVEGKPAEVLARIQREWDDQKPDRRRAEAAIERIADWTEPNWFAEPERMAEEAMALHALKAGTRVVSLDDSTHGRLGSIVKVDGHSKVKLDGDPHPASANVEPLDPKLSWRKPVEKAVVERPLQRSLFGRPDNPIRYEQGNLYAGKWITIGGKPGPGGTEHSGGFRVQIDRDGNILAGGPPALRGKNVSEVKGIFDEMHGKTQGPHISHEHRQEREERLKEREQHQVTGEPWTGKGTPQTGKVYNVPTHELHVDPSRFQFKLNTNKKGVTDELLGVRKFNPDFAGTLAVWKDPANGKTYVVNGHHRHELAERLGQDNLAVRYVEAKDATEARALGALINIAEGRGTAVDAAKFMRDMGVDQAAFEKRGISLKGKVSTDAVALSSLSDRTFARLANGHLDQNTALAVAKNLPNPELQDKLFHLLDKRAEDEKPDLPLRALESMAQEMAETPSQTKTEASLFGHITTEESLFVPRNELKAHIGAELSKEVNDFMAVASKRRAERVGKTGGNILDVDANKEVADEANRVKNVFRALVNRRGPISDAVNQGAAEFAAAKGKSAKDAIRERTFHAVRDAVLREAGLGKADGGAERPTLRGGEATPGGGREGPAGYAAGYEGRGDHLSARLTDARPQRYSLFHGQTPTRYSLFQGRPSSGPAVYTPTLPKLTIDEVRRYLNPGQPVRPVHQLFTGLRR